jgi:hypothetical protein
VAIPLGPSVYLALRADGRVSSWGSPVAPASLSNVVAISAGSDHGIALRSDGTIQVWGSNTYGQSNVPPSASSVVAIAAGYSHDLALRSDGTVVAWGLNTSGQCNVPANATNVVAIAAKGLQSMALRSDGTVVAWGNSSYGLNTVPPWVTNVVAIAAGYYHNLALRGDGTVAGWGSGAGMVVPAGLSNVAAIAAGTSHGLALRSDGTVAVWGTYNGSTAFAPADMNSVIQIAGGGERAMALFGNRSPYVTVQPWARTAFRGTATTFVAKAVGAPPLSYQWRFRGMDIPSATADTLTLIGLDFSQSGAYQLQVTNGYGLTKTLNAKLVVTIPLGEALDATNLPWTSSGSALWFGQPDDSVDGLGAARSGAIGNSQETILQTSITGPGQLSWWWKVTSEPVFDFLQMRLGSVVQAAISGEVGWEQRTMRIPSGAQTVQWRYAKDVSFSEGQDAACLDQVVFTADPPVITQQPVGATVQMGSARSIYVSATGTPPLSYQWLKNGAILPNATASFMVFPKPTRHDSGTYAVLVTNPGGTVSSSNAVFKVLVPQLLRQPVLQAGGSLLLLSGDADGALLLPEDLVNLEAQASTNLIDWRPQPGGLTLTNGLLQWQDADRANFARRFYRIIER